MLSPKQGGAEPEAGSFSHPFSHCPGQVCVSDTGPAGARLGMGVVLNAPRGRMVGGRVQT